MIEVHNLASNETHTYDTTSPLDAVCLAWANAMDKSLGDVKYLKEQALKHVVIGQHSVACGDWCTKLAVTDGVADANVITTLRQMVSEYMRKDEVVLIAVYENKDLGHSEIGHKQFLFIGPTCTYQSAPERLPDFNGAINWRYLHIGYLDFFTNTLVDLPQQFSGRPIYIFESQSAYDQEFSKQDLAKAYLVAYQDGDGYRIVKSRYRPISDNFFTAEEFESLKKETMQKLATVSCLTQMLLFKDEMYERVDS